MVQNTNWHTSWGNKILRIVVITAGILSIPFLSTVFNLGFNWNLVDFIIAGLILVCAGLAYQLLSSSRSNTQRLTIGVVIIAVTILIWAELAVGIFETPFAGN